MSASVTQASDINERTVVNRDPEVAAARCLAYAAMSDLMSSPHDVQSSVREAEQSVDLSGLPYDVAGLAEVIEEYRSAPIDELKRAYSSMFEVGSDGPPVPIREDLQLGQKTGTREDLVRFYDFFGYTLGDKFAWAPDHLSVELEFMHYLSYGEVTRLADGNAEEAASFQLAQADFIERHLVNWIAKLVHEVQEQNAESVYCRVVTTLQAFLTADYEWQSATIIYSQAKS